MNRVVKILMKRDEMTEKEANRLLEDTRMEINEAAAEGRVDVDDIIQCNLGLEPDYLFDII